MRIFRKKRAIAGFLRERKAFTLIETVAVTVLVGMVVAGGAASVVPIMHFFRTEQQDTVLSDNMGTALEQIKKDIIRACLHNASGGSPNTVTLTIRDYVGGAPDETIVYSVATAANPQRRELQRNGTPIFVDKATTTKPVSLTATFTGISDNSLRVELSIDHDGDSATPPVVKRATVMLRCRSG